jgi:hypothetical protein
MTQHRDYPACFAVLWCITVLILRVSQFYDAAPCSSFVFRSFMTQHRVHPSCFVVLWRSTVFILRVSQFYDAAPCLSCVFRSFMMHHRVYPACFAVLWCSTVFILHVSQFYDAASCLSCVFRSFMMQHLVYPACFAVLWCSTVFVLRVSQFCDATPCSSCVFRSFWRTSWFILRVPQNPIDCSVIYTKSPSPASCSAIDSWRLRPLRRTVAFCSRRTNSLFAHASVDTVQHTPVFFSRIWFHCCVKCIDWAVETCLLAGDIPFE